MTGLLTAILLLGLPLQETLNQAPQTTAAVEAEEPWQFAMLIVSPIPAPRYEVRSTTNWIDWESCAIVDNQNPILILDCEKQPMKFWSLVPLADP